MTVRDFIQKLLLEARNMDAEVHFTVDDGRSVDLEYVLSEIKKYDNDVVIRLF